MISGYLLRLTKDEEAAKELTQETFVRAFSGFLKFEWRGISLAGFLFKIARNCFNGWWKRAKLNREFPVDLDNLDVVAKEETDKKIHQSEDAEVLASCLASIRPDFSEIIDLYYWGGLGTSEIAIVLKMKHPTVKSHLLRGRKALEKEMEKRGLVFASFSGLLGSENSDIEREGDSGGIGKTDQERLPI